MGKAAKAKTAARTAPTPHAQKYTLEKLRDKSQEIFGIPGFAFDGAMTGHEGPLTLEDAKAIIAAWKNKPVKAISKAEVK